jgi:hypothetical protein
MSRVTIRKRKMLQLTAVLFDSPPAVEMPWILCKLAASRKSQTDAVTRASSARAFIEMNQEFTFPISTRTGVES